MLPGGDGIGPRVLAAIAPEGTAPATLADRLGAPPPTVHEAFAEGRLSSSELEQRTGQALASRTYGELDDVLTGLADMHRPARSHGHPMRKALFWVVALLSTPFVLFGSLLLLGGSDTDDLVAGLVVLVVVLPGVFALRRWAWPRG